MADTVVKLSPSQQPEIQQTQTAKRAAAPPRRSRLRLILLVVVPLLAAGAGLGLYLAGGRYISTDNAYVGAQKVLITPDISGKISRVFVREGEKVAAGAPLLEIDPVPFRLAVQQAEGRLAGVRTEFANLKTNLRSVSQLVELAHKNVELKQRDVARKTTLMSTHAGSQADVDVATAGLVAAQNQEAQLEQQAADIRNQLLGNPDLPIEQYPPFVQANAALDQAQRDLAHTTLRAPIAGTATQVDNIQLGRFVSAGSAILSVFDTNAPWVDANPKETDITYLQIGQSVTIDVDTFPDHTFHGKVAAVSPGTGAQFAILPPQNASGNWVKIVQRVPVRIAFDRDENTDKLRAGMSANIDIDTGRSRSIGSLLTTLASAVWPTSTAAAKQ